ncbi:hypothetical protein M569_05558 [Genlisea aurea]|uniref:Uncharacterized protein n=1 Tax=Genlisea aurea TaxID=192259 RepID=S8CW74_9LAMI|nr:hypothetical protein M569_05558 [Genlisea aurea]
MSEQQPPLPDAAHGGASPSFVPAAGVLALIAAVSFCACVLGRIAGRWRSMAEEEEEEAIVQGVGPKEWEKPKFRMGEDGDIEFGFQKKKKKKKKKKHISESFV